MKIQFRKILHIFIAVLLLIISVSCTSTKTLTIEIPSKGKKELPMDIQSLTLVNRTVDNSYTDLHTDSLQRIFYKQNFKLDTIIKDVQAVDTTLKALGELLFESGRYDFVIPENRFLEFEKNSFLNTEMPAEQIRQLCETYSTDAVLSLDHFKTQVITNYEKDSFFDQLMNGFSSYSYAEMAVIYEALFRVYEPIQGKVLLREFMRDTIVWEDANKTTGALFRGFTPVKSALSEAGIATALDFSDIISTSWRESRRIYFYKGDADLKHGTQLVDDGEWESALALWKDIAEKSKSKSVRSKAEFNIAVGYELQGNLNEAINWALKSYNSMYRPVTYNYLEILKRRKNDLKKQQP
jgi:hypothetical protein